MNKSSIHNSYNTTIHYSGETGRIDEHARLPVRRRERERGREGERAREREKERERES